MAAEHESNMPTVYGNIQYVVTHKNVDGGSSSIEHADNGSTIGVKHDHEIAPGLTGFFKAELEYDADDKAGNEGLNSFDEAYVGVESDSFGKVWIGSDDSTYERAVAKIYNFHEVGTGIDGSYSTGEGDLLQYETPSFGGLKLGAAVQVNGDGDERTEGEKSYPYQLAAIYSVDALELAFAMDSNDGELGYSEKDDGKAPADDELDPNDENTYGLRATYTMGDFSLTGEYQTRKDVKDEYGVIGVYSLGANQFSVAYQLTEDDSSAQTSGDKESVVALQALHNVSDNLYVYAEGYMYNTDGDYADSVTGDQDEKQVAAVGLNYYF
jgi:predicted porin